MMIDDATLFLSKFTDYPEDVDLYNIVPEIYKGYLAECIDNNVIPYDWEDFMTAFIIWFNQKILIIN